MIRIEDEEDVEAFREARAEIDDEFKEEENAATLTTKAPEEENQEMDVG